MSRIYGLRFGKCFHRTSVDAPSEQRKVKIIQKGRKFHRVFLTHLEVVREGTITLRGIRHYGVRMVA